MGSNSLVARKIMTMDELAKHREVLQKQGKSVVQCHGCFDIVHPGHIRYLRYAKGLGDVLIVSVSSDETVGKGVDRPYIPENLRLENLAAFEFVDYVCLSDEDWGGPVLEKLKPDVYVKGKEYESSHDPRFVKEKNIVEGYGGRVVFSSGDVVFSSTEIIRRFGDRYQLDADRVHFFCKRNGITRSRMEDLMAKFQDLRVVVVGDAILDHYVYCEQTSVASEGPILSVTPIEEDWYVGGPGLVARQLAAFGAEVVFVTAAEKGPDLDRLSATLARENITLEAAHVPGRQVYVKTRYLAADQKLFKVNRGLYSPLPASTSEEVEKTLTRLMPDSDGVVVLDFGYGFFGEPLCAAIAKASQERGVPYYADVSTSGRSNLLKFAHPRLVTPTEQEIRFALADTESGLSSLAARYYQQSHAENLLITLGKRGAIYFERPSSESSTRLRTAYLPALSSVAIDTVGAGDMLLTGTVLTDLAGGTTPEGTYLGSVMSALKIRDLGNDIVSLRDTLEYLRERPELS